MGNTNSGRIRGVWSRYTPASSPFANKYLDKLYKFPSLQQMKKFDEDVEELKHYYGEGKVMFDDEGYEMSYLEAIEYIYNRKFEKWLKTK